MTENKNDLSDEELMILYQAGDFQAFEVLYRRHSGRVFGYLKRKVSVEIAQELLQEIFGKLHASRDKYNPQYPLLPWLFTVSRNTLFSFFKQKETKLAWASNSDQTLIESIPAAAGDVPANFEMTDILAGLPKHQKKAMELRYLYDWSFERIATDMKTSEDNVRQLVSRAVKKLRLTLGQKRGDS